ncbi:ABC transporter ATP-binding protein [Desulfosporosinus fructosivorans]|uniref:ABC transporter ATP-binding protein n=1 Tax=Desulfosporosinus fructosivorans TaxID=2018669 RepID=A0A4Z0R7I5_9FIRM|nr:ABC transporter ATP-binding protein [Desulfosporosinus fructosivorans]TGE38093.1 ABC transporter ATP-binding protein [Desulfosporosinus fructosivorans]
MELLKVRDLKIFTPDNRSLVHGLNFSIHAGEWFALIGESGSGKSISAFALSALLPNGLRREVQEIQLLGKDLSKLSEWELRKIRGTEIAYVFQDYQSAFTPYFRLGRQMDEVMQAHTDWSKGKRQTKAWEALNEVGLEGAEVYRRYPFQLSGGQLQRAALTLAMMMEPKLLIADEPTSALDAMSANTVLTLLARLKNEKGCAVLFITHDLRCVRRYADRVAIMQNGSIIEAGPKQEVFKNPREVYTQNLLASVPPLYNPPRRLPILGQEPLEEGTLYATTSNA